MIEDPDVKTLDATFTRVVRSIRSGRVAEWKMIFRCREIPKKGISQSGIRAPATMMIAPMNIEILPMMGIPLYHW